MTQWVWLPPPLPTLSGRIGPIRACYLKPPGRIESAPLPGATSPLHGVQVGAGGIRSLMAHHGGGGVGHGVGHGGRHDAPMTMMEILGVLVG